MKFNLKDLKRFEKQIIIKNIGISGQKKIFNSKVLIITLEFGCPLITYLATQCWHYWNCDNDKVEVSNLNRQHFSQAVLES